MAMKNRTIIRGTHWYLTSTFKLNNAALDMTAGTRTVTLRFRKLRPTRSTSNDFTRITSNSSHGAYVSQANGSFKWQFLSDETIGAGSGKEEYRVDAIFHDSSTSPEQYQVLASAVYTFQDPPTGATA